MDKIRIKGTKMTFKEIYDSIYESINSQNLTEEDRIFCARKITDAIWLLQLKLDGADDSSINSVLRTVEKNYNLTNV